MPQRWNRWSSLAFLFSLMVLTVIPQAHAAPPAVTAVGFAATEAEVAVYLTNAGNDLVTLSVTAPKAGQIVLTGSGCLTLITGTSTPSPLWAWANISIGVPGNHTNGDVTRVQMPDAMGGGRTYQFPFSITSVFQVQAGANTFSMAGQRDPNGAFSDWYGDNLKLTAIFVERGM